MKLINFLDFRGYNHLVNPNHIIELFEGENEPFSYYIRISECGKYKITQETYDELYKLMGCIN